ISSMLGLAEEVRLNFIHSMTLLALSGNKNQDSSGNLIKVRSNQKKLRKWAENAPGNFKAKFILVEAEMAALEKKFESASKLFSEAKEAARNSNIMQDLALVNERTAVFYKEHGFMDL